MNTGTESPAAEPGTSTRKPHRVCPWWIGYLLASPLRKLSEDPERLLSPLVRPGMRVLDFGAAMGYYSLAAARLVGEAGRVTSLDLQPKMLAELRRRASRAGLSSRIETVVCPADSLGSIDRTRPYDLVLAVHVLHEVPDPDTTLRDLAGVLVSGGLLVLIEPRGHVAEMEFAREVAKAKQAGFLEHGGIELRRGFGVVLAKRA